MQQSPEGVWRDISIHVQVSSVLPTPNKQLDAPRLSDLPLKFLAFLGDITGIAI